MYNIAICVPTYKRPYMLEKLIISIIESNFNQSFTNNVNLIIADNDIEKTAENTVTELKKRFNDKMEIEYHNFPVKGLSNVRNELLRKSLDLSLDFIVFVDDDEYVSAAWLNELIEALISNNGDMAMGPVISVFDSAVSKYISCWFNRPVYRKNAKLNSIATNNLIIKSDSLVKNDVWFDNRFNYTGSEDSYFGIQMIKKGAKIFWAENAIVYETVPKNRANLKWLIQRRYRVSGTYTYIMNLEKKYFKILQKTLINMAYILIGICALIVLPLPIKKKYWGILKITEGVGGLTGFFNTLYQEYK